MFNSINDIKGNNVVKSLISKSLAKGYFPSALLFTGDIGTGKSDMAVFFAKSITCESITSSGFCGKCVACLNSGHLKGSVTETDRIKLFDVPKIVADNKVEKMTDDIFKFATFKNSRYVFILEEIHSLSELDQELFYYSLTQLKEHITILATTSKPEKLTKAFKSRFDTYKMRNLSSVDTIELFKELLHRVDFSDQLLHNIYNNTKGNPRVIKKLVELTRGLSLEQEDIAGYLDMINYEEIASLFIESTQPYLFIQKLNEIINEYEHETLVSSFVDFLYDLVCSFNGTNTSVSKMLELLPKTLNETSAIKIAKSILATKDNDELMITLLSVRQSLAKPMSVSAQTIKTDTGGKVEKPQPTSTKNNNPYGIKMDLLRED